MPNIKSPEERRSQNITVRLTQTEVKLVDDEAENKQCTRTDIIRELIHGSEFYQNAQEQE